MGQGTYGAFGFGAVLTEEQRTGLFGEDGDLKIKVKDRPLTAYESDVPYVVYLIFDSGGYTNAGHDARFACALVDIAAEAEARFPKEYLSAKKSWAAFVKAADKAGVQLPIGKLIYVHDYD